MRAKYMVRIATQCPYAGTTPICLPFMTSPLFGESDDENIYFQIKIAFLLIERTPILL